MRLEKEWIREETKSVNLGDKRLEKRLSRVMKSLSSSSRDSIPKSCESWSETIAAYRFFSHKKLRA
ncbi:MAG: hypothetical protein COA94_00565 [Rickettsiales bacterium]|nr:MAG: hypothetical protein COA94_00565 [Rickettsiales bacterium]